MKELRQLIKIVTDSRKSGEQISHFGGVTENGLIFRELNQFCFGSLSYLGREQKIDERGYVVGVKNHNYKSDPLKFFVFSHGNKHLSKNNALKWIDFFVKRSQFAKCYLTKNAEFVYEHAAIMNTKYHPAIHIAAGIFDRYRTENPQFINQWVELIDAGLTENEALLFSHFITIDKAGLLNLVKYRPDNSNHYVFQVCDGDPFRETIQNFLDGNQIYENSRIFSTNLNYLGVSSLWATNGSKKNILKPNYEGLFVETDVKDAFGDIKTCKTIPKKNMLKAFEMFCEVNNLKR